MLFPLHSKELLRGGDGHGTRASGLQRPPDPAGRRAAPRASAGPRWKHDSGRRVRRASGAGISAGGAGGGLALDRGLRGRADRSV